MHLTFVQPPEATRNWATGRLLTLLLPLLCVLVLALPTRALAAGLTPIATDNIGTYEYGNGGWYNWASPTTSYLTTSATGALERVEWTGSELAVEDYDSTSYELVSQRVIDAGQLLPAGASADNLLWGGYYRSSQAQYVFTGQPNANEDDGVAVVRVTKFDLNWNRLDAIDITGVNTYEPFDAGSLRVTEQDGKLYVLTCHTIYAIQSVHHQANMEFVISESPFKLVDSRADVTWSRTGYVSHSFNQYIVSLGSSIYTLNHGDAYPRSVVLGRQESIDQATTMDVLKINGATGANYTGVTVGGFQGSASANTLLSAGTSVEQDSDGPNSGTKRNVWLACNSASDDMASRSFMYLTDYPASGEADATCVKLVKMSDDRFLLMWNEGKLENEWVLSPQAGSSMKHITYPNSVVKYLFVDGNGNELSSVQTMYGYLNEMQPVMVGDRAVWYVTGRTVDDSHETSEPGPAFYWINSNGTSGKSEYCAVSFSGDGVSQSSYHTQFLREGSVLARPADPSRNGYDFAGWTTDAAGTSPYDFGAAVTGNVTLYAQWTRTSVDLSEATITLDLFDAVYTGAEIRPEVTVWVGDEEVDPAAYTVTYANNVHAADANGTGAPTATVTAKDGSGYTGSASATFTIERKSVTVTANSYTINQGDPEPTLTATVEGLVGTDTVSYTLSRTAGTDAGTYTTIPSGDTVQGNYTVTYKTGTLTIVATSGPATPTQPSEPTQPTEPTASSVPMYRCYNPNSGEHFYTASAGERDHIVSVGWSYEGVGWTAPKTSNSPVYRLYNANGGEHHYTLSAAERDMLVGVGWSYEGVGWYSDDARSVPLYRQYNPNAFSCNHNYTTSQGENDWLVSLGWRAEGIAWYGVN